MIFEYAEAILWYIRKASTRIAPGGITIRTMFAELAPADQARLCDAPQSTVARAPKVEGAGRGRPRNVGIALAPTIASSPDSNVEPPSFRLQARLYNPSPTPLRQLQQTASASPALSEYSLHDLQEMSQSRSFDPRHDSHDEWDLPEDEEEGTVQGGNDVEG